MATDLAGGWSAVPAMPAQAITVFRRQNRVAKSLVSPSRSGNRPPVRQDDAWEVTQIPPHVRLLQMAAPNDSSRIGTG